MASGSSKQTGTRAKAAKAKSQGVDDGGQAAAKLVAMLRPGACFSVWTSDYDASDLYPLRIDELKPDFAAINKYKKAQKLEQVIYAQSPLDQYVDLIH